MRRHTLLKKRKVEEKDDSKQQENKRKQQLHDYRQSQQKKWAAQAERIFISHTSSGRDIVHELRKKLEEAGILLVGDKTKSTKCLIILTEDYAKDECTRAELEFFLQEKYLENHGFHPVFYQIKPSDVKDYPHLNGFDWRINQFVGVVNSSFDNDAFVNKLVADLRWSTTSKNEIGKHCIFISHNGAQKNFARKIATILQGNGFSCFFDETSMRSGTYFPTTIANALYASSMCINIFSKGFTKSIWCQMENRNSFMYEKEIIPIYYDITPDECYDLGIFQSTKGSSSRLKGFMMDSDSEEDQFISDTLLPMIRSKAESLQPAWKHNIYSLRIQQFDEALNKFGIKLKYNVNWFSIIRSKVETGTFEHFAWKLGVWFDYEMIKQKFKDKPNIIESLCSYDAEGQSDNKRMRFYLGDIAHDNGWIRNIFENDSLFLLFLSTNIEHQCDHITSFDLIQSGICEHKVESVQVLERVEKVFSSKPRQPTLDLSAHVCVPKIFGYTKSTAQNLEAVKHVMQYFSNLKVSTVAIVVHKVKSGLDVFDYYGSEFRSLKTGCCTYLGVTYNAMTEKQIKRTNNLGGVDAVLGLFISDEFLRVIFSNCAGKVVVYVPWNIDEVRYAQSLQGAQCLYKSSDFDDWN